MLEGHLGRNETLKYVESIVKSIMKSDKQVM